MKPKKLTHEQLNAMPLWKLLDIGLRDLRKHERTKGCVVSMESWCCMYEGKCYACLAGSVLRHEFESRERLGHAEAAQRPEGGRTVTKEEMTTEYRAAFSKALIELGPGEIDYTVASSLFSAGFKLGVELYAREAMQMMQRVKAGGSGSRAEGTEA